MVFVQSQLLAKKPFEFVLSSINLLKLPCVLRLMQLYLRPI